MGCWLLYFCWRWERRGAGRGSPKYPHTLLQPPPPSTTDRTHGHTVTSNRIEQLKEEMYLGVIIHLLTNLKFCYVLGAHDLSSAMRLRHRLSHGSSCFIYWWNRAQVSTALCMHSSNDQCLVTHVDSCTEWFVFFISVWLFLLHH